MRGLVNLFVDKQTEKISILVYHVTTIGFYESMGYMKEIDSLDNLKNSVDQYLNYSISKYNDDNIEDVDPFKKTKYKTWNKFFSNNYLIEVSYDMKGKVYEIRLPEREKETKSFGNTIVGFDFQFTKEEYNEKFDDIIRYILDNIRTKQE